MWILKIFRKAQAIFIRSPPELFDTAWYATNYHDLNGLKDLWSHYQTIGAFEGRLPNPLFDSKWYLNKHVQLSIEKRNPLLHYIQQGVAEGTDPHPLFSTSWYLRRYQDVAQADINPLTHYLRYGAAEGRSPSPFFDAPWYLDQYPEVAHTGINPLVHYLEHGRDGSYNPNPYFDSTWYIGAYLANEKNSSNPLIHFIEYGEDAGYNPSAKFDGEAYRDRYADLTDYRGGLFRHFLEYGQHEGRQPGPRPTHFVTVNALHDFLSTIPPSLEPTRASAQMKVESIPRWIVNRSNPDVGRIVFSSQSTSFKAISKVSFPQGPYVSLLRDVSAIAGTRYIFASGNTILHDEEHHFYNVEGAYLKYFNGKRTKNDCISIKFDIRQAAWIECGINVMHEYSNNYFHFIAETIPRIILTEEAGLPLGVPYLFEESLHHNIRDIIARLIGESRPIIWLRSGTLFKIKELYVPSDLTTVIDAYDGGAIAKQSALDISRIRTGVERCKSTLTVPVLSPKRKIFASRNGGIRKLLNQDALEQYFSALGFEIVCTDGMSLETQIRTFQEAEVVIGPTGAQMSNIIWCEPNTTVIVLASDHPSHQLYLWELLGKVSGINVKTALGPRAYTKNGKYSVHDDYTVSPDEVMALI